MRKVQKEQVDNLLKILNQAHEEIKHHIEKENFQQVLALLGDCQEGALAVGNFIEKIEGEGIATISILEKYCEVTYYIYEGLMQGQVFGAEEVYQNLQELFVQIEDSVTHDIKIRKEVVFLPYKASMWDSLESVWKAAKEDPNCDVYVIPIPYFDRKSDGRFGEMHYEGDLYPSDVPITHYGEFDLQAHRPDTIFIHNPYDDYNMVTSVHPHFYSSRLKNYTDNLVYIPYFVLDEIEPENKAAVEGMAHFCTTPAVIYADKVIVQSEKMKQIYVNVLTEYAGEHTRMKWEKKILGLGSPKLDKVRGIQKETLDIPTEWLNIIQKPDGSWKKIIFYNTSISSLLQHNEKMLEKMEDVFRIFKENQEEVALLWRPHPLIEATITSMRPNLWKQYQAMVEQYRSEAWGIYDDSPKLERAIGISDAYYGDPSSVVELCKVSGKPIMIQNVAVMEGK